MRIEPETERSKLMRQVTSVVTLCGAALLCACAGDQERSDEPTAEPVATDCSGGTSNEVVLATNMGEIAIELLPERSPISVENFLSYVESCFYDGTVFHRIMPGFMIQTGGFTDELAQKQTGAPIENEADNGLKNERGTVAMARRPEPNSATSQFYINLVDNEILNHGVRDFGYAVFGRVTQGMDVVDAIAALPTSTRNGMPNVPVETVTITSARRR
jgi:peptidyl-prolyl cis-trans isomerase A (cyclophilin A)